MFPGIGTPVSGSQSCPSFALKYCVVYAVISSGVRHSHCRSRTVRVRLNPARRSADSAQVRKTVRVSVNCSGGEVAAPSMSGCRGFTVSPPPLRTKMSWQPQKPVQPHTDASVAPPASLCAGHVQSFGGASPLPDPMEVRVADLPSYVAQWLHGPECIALGLYLRGRQNTQ